MDKGIQLALEYREELAQQAVYKRLSHPGGDRAQSKALAAALRNAQVVVWGKEAHEKLSAYWDDEQKCLEFGERVFRDRLMAVSNVAHRLEVRIIPEWTQRSYFHFFPPEPKIGAVGVKVPPQISSRTLRAMLSVGEQLPNYVRKHLIETLHFIEHGGDPSGSHNIASPIAGTVFYPYGGGIQHAAVYYPLLGLQSERSNPCEIEDYVTAIADYHHPIHGEWCDDQSTALTLYYHYQRMFWLESTFVHTEHHRARKHSLPSFKLPDKDEKVQIVYMRKSEPKIDLPEGFRVRMKEGGGSWQLEFEVDVRGHPRRLRSGKVVWVRPHVKGPRGVRRTRIIKAIR